jgi:osmotically-inducible protein OsmY
MIQKMDHPSELDQRVQIALTGSGHFTCNSRLKLFADRGVVTLRGKVRTFYQKQMAQEIAKSIDGVSQIENHLEVAGWS